LPRSLAQDQQGFDYCCLPRFSLAAALAGVNVALSTMGFFQWLSPSKAAVSETLLI
jgi:hypothetical protein